MTRQSNLYFFRESQGYSPSDVAERVSVEDLRAGSDAVEEILDDLEINRSVLENSKREIIREVHDACSDEEFQDVAERVINEVGEAGDKANLQIYHFERTDRDSLIQTLEEADSNSDDYLLSRLDSYKQSDDSRAIDMKFVVEDVGDFLSKNDLELMAEGDNISLDELIRSAEDEGILEEFGIDRVSQLREREDLLVEARLYPESGILFVSNRDIWDDLQTTIENNVGEWAGARSSGGDLALNESELLYFQNVMQGENSGLDYSNFMKGRLNTAKYRGDRKKSLTRSPVLDPAQDEGTVTQVRYYYSYDDWDIQVRVHDDAHVTTTKFTNPDFVDEMEHHLRDILEYRPYLKSMDTHIDEISNVLVRERTHFNPRNYRKTRKEAFDSFIRENIDEESYTTSDIQVYSAILSNICIELCRLDLNSDDYPSPEVPDRSDFPEHEREFESFLDDYFKTIVEEPNPDFDTVFSHIHHIFTSIHQQPAESPLDLVKSVCEEYDIPS